MFRKIIAFVAVAEEGSFTAAAEKLNIAQPWLSTQVKQLEQSLGFALFRRSKRAVDLTPQGQAILNVCKKIDGAYQEFREVAESCKREKDGQLSIGCEMSTIHDPIRFDIMERFIRAFPVVDLRVINENADLLFTHLYNRKIDIAYAPLPLSDKRFEFVVMSAYEIVLLVPRKHELAQFDIVNGSELSGSKILSGNHDFSRSCNPSQDDMLPEVSWVQPPDADYESRYHLVQMMGLPSLWIDYPVQPHRLPENLKIVRFRNPIFCNFGFAKLAGNDSGPVRKFMNLARQFASAKPAIAA